MLRSPLSVNNNMIINTSTNYAFLTGTSYMNNLIVYAVLRKLLCYRKQLLEEHGNKMWYILVNRAKIWNKQLKTLLLYQGFL